ncbi:E3 SUMO-protein ligase ZBED1-like [Diabrotica undecimpunctata]|uniref:E3 SUMO-protein ligase ZBED1-like n=1 Tax=Diabrotica undecimpunctata TaxID=50387 RepID=UPI003B636051
MTQQKKLDQLLLNLIIKDFQPFSMVEDNGFKDFILTLNPAYKLPTRKTLSNVLLPEVFEEVRLKASDVLKEVVSIIITTDCWTSRNTDSNVLVGDALKLIQEVTLNKVSKIVTHFKQSANAKSKLDNVQRQQGKEPKKLKKDVVTRWNFTYLMLERFVELEEAIRTTLALMVSVFLPVIPTEEWAFIKELIIILKPFYDITELISAEKYVTLSLVIVITNGLKNVCNMLSSNQFSNDISKRVIEKLIESITFRLGDLESSITLIVSTFLDPRFKNVCFIKPGTFDKAKEIVIGLVAQNILANSTSNEDVMMEVESANTSRTLESETEKPLFDIWKQLNKSVSSQPKLTQSPQARAIVEVNRYLEEEMILKESEIDLQPVPSTSREEEPGTPLQLGKKPRLQTTRITNYISRPISIARQHKINDLVLNRYDNH